MKREVRRKGGQHPGSWWLLRIRRYMRLVCPLQIEGSIAASSAIAGFHCRVMRRCRGCIPSGSKPAVALPRSYVHALCCVEISDRRIITVSFCIDNGCIFNTGHWRRVVGASMPDVAGLCPTCQFHSDAFAFSFLLDSSRFIFSCRSSSAF